METTGSKAGECPSSRIERHHKPRITTAGKAVAEQELLITSILALFWGIRLWRPKPFHMSQEV